MSNVRPLFQPLAELDGGTKAREWDKLDNECICKFFHFHLTIVGKF